MATKTFNAAPAFMPNSICYVSNGIWGIELHKSLHGHPEVRFERDGLTSFGNVWDDGLFHFSVDGAGIPPKYVMDKAMQMWRDIIA